MNEIPPKDAMSLITPISDQECLDKCLNDDLGPAVIVATKYCFGDTQAPVICIPCDDQRGDLSLEAQRTFTEINNQCSQRTTKRESGKNLMVNVSLGKGAKRMDLLAALFDVEITADPTTPNSEVVEIFDDPGACPCHYQVAILPIEGSQVVTTFGIVLEFAITKTDQFTYVFSPNTQREVQLTFEAESHPTTNRLGFFIKSNDGNPCPLLVPIAQACSL